MPDTVISVGGDIRDISSKLKQVEQGLGNVASKARSGSGGDFLGGAAGQLGGMLAGVVGLQQIKGVVDDFDRLGEQAERLNVTTASMQKLGYQAKFSGVEVETVIKSLEKMNRQVQGGDKKTLSALSSLNLDAAKLAGMAPEEAIIEIADAFQKAEAQGRGLSEVNDLFGKQYGQLLPLLRKTRGELEEMGRLPVISDEAIKRAGDFNDALDRIAITTKADTIGVMEDLGAIGGALWVQITQGTEASTKALKAYQAELKATEKAAKDSNDAEKEKREAQARADEARGKQESADSISAATEEKKARFAFDQLSLAEQKEDVENRIAAINKQKEGALDPEQAATLQSELVDLLQQQVRIKQDIATENEKAAKAAKEEMKTALQKAIGRAEATQDLGAELAILQAKANGQSKIVEQLEREQRIREAAAKIADETGFNAADSLKLAETKIGLEDKAANREGGRGRIRGANATGRAAALAARDAGGLAAFEERQNTPLRDTFKTPALDAFKAANQRDAKGNLISPIGKGQGKNLAQQGQQKADQQARVTDPTALLQQAVEELRGLRQEFQVVN